MHGRTLYAACISRLGLSQDDAAELHGVLPSKVHRWVKGKRNPKPGVSAELARYQEVLDAHIRRLQAELVAGSELDIADPDLPVLDWIARAQLFLDGAASLRGRHKIALASDGDGDEAEWSDTEPADQEARLAGAASNDTDDDAA